MGKRGFLILSRHVDEGIVINDGEIEIIVVDIRGDKVRLGISAPKHIEVHRSEVVQRIKENEIQRLENEK